LFGKQDDHDHFFGRGLLLKLMSHVPQGFFPLTLGPATPNPVLFPLLKGEHEAGDADCALGADRTTGGYPLLPVRFVPFVVFFVPEEEVREPTAWRDVPEGSHRRGLSEWSDGSKVGSIAVRHRFQAS
jgi:hypothetical protein